MGHPDDMSPTKNGNGGKRREAKREMLTYNLLHAHAGLFGILALAVCSSHM